MFENVWKCLDMAGNGWKSLEMSENLWKCLEIYLLPTLAYIIILQFLKNVTFSKYEFVSSNLKNKIFVGINILILIKTLREKISHINLWSVYKGKNNYNLFLYPTTYFMCLLSTQYVSTKVYDPCLIHIKYNIDILCWIALDSIMFTYV